MSRKKSFFITLLSMLCCVIFSGCLPLQTCSSGNTQDREQLKASIENLNGRLKSGLYRQKVDNLIVIVDDTDSMKDCVDGSSKKDQAGNLVYRIAQTLPDIKLVKGVRIYGPDIDEWGNQTTLFHGADRFPRSELKDTIFTKTVSDTLFNPLAMAIEGAYHELKLIEGNSAIVIISDFKDPLRNMLYSAELIRQYYEGRVCIYPIVVGTDGDGRNSAEHLVETIGCGSAALADALASGQSLADYVEKILFNKEEPLDSFDAVAPEPKQTAKPEQLSYKNLLKERKITVELKAEFDFDKSIIKEVYLDHLKEIAAFMDMYQNTVTTIEGHTCSIGTKEYNLALSVRRAQSVKKHLVALGVSPERLNIAAYGETTPIADNSSLEGRRKNRRAVAVITTSVQEYIKQNKGILKK